MRYAHIRFLLVFVAAPLALVLALVAWLFGAEATFMTGLAIGVYFLLGMHALGREELEWRIGRERLPRVALIFWVLWPLRWVPPWMLVRWIPTALFAATMLYTLIATVPWAGAWTGVPWAIFAAGWIVEEIRQRVVLGGLIWPYTFGDWLADRVEQFCEQNRLAGAICAL